VELRDSQGTLILNSGATVQWQPGGVGSYVTFGVTDRVKPSHR
jgi:hypothetical protein